MKIILPTNQHMHVVVSSGADYGCANGVLVAVIKFEY